MLSRTSSPWRGPLLTLLAVSLYSPSSPAAELYLHLDYVGSFEGDLTPTAYSLTDSSFGPVDPTDLHQFQVSFSLVGAAESPEESLQGILFDVAMGPGVSPYIYLASVNPVYDPPPPGPSGGLGVLWTENGDFGGDTEDLQRIGFFTNREAAHGLDPGEASPFYLGDFFVNWDTSVSSNFDVEVKYAESAFADPWSLWVGESDFWIGGPETLHGERFTVAIPEPASAMLAAMALVGLTAVTRRRQ